MRKQFGFTLPELMFGVAIVGILAAVAYPSYTQQILNSRRGDAQGTVTAFANAMERYFTLNSTYLGAAGTTVNPTNTGTPRPDIFAAQAPVDGLPKTYNLTIQAATATSYTLRATPITTGPQKNDGLFELDSTGARRWDKNNDGDTLDTGENAW